MVFQRRASSTAVHSGSPSPSIQPSSTRVHRTTDSASNTLPITASASTTSVSLSYGTHGPNATWQDKMLVALITRIRLEVCSVIVPFISGCSHALAAAMLLGLKSEHSRSRRINKTTHRYFGAHGTHKAESNNVDARRVAGESQQGAFMIIARFVQQI